MGNEFTESAGHLTSAFVVAFEAHAMRLDLPIPSANFPHSKSSEARHEGQRRFRSGPACMDETPKKNIPNQGRGRPKGAKDTRPRYRSKKAVLPADIIAVAKRELIGLGPEGRGLDEIGILRSAGMAIVGALMREIGHLGEGANDRRKGLINAFEVVHRAEVESTRLSSFNRPSGGSASHTEITFRDRP